MPEPNAMDLLLVEDDQVIASLYLAYLSDEPYRIRHVSDGGSALAAISDTVPDVILLDLRLPDMDGFEVLKIVHDKNLETEVIVVTGHGSTTTAIDAMRLGARDFLVKPFSKDRLVTTLNNITESLRLKRIVDTYRKTIDRQQFFGFLGSSLAMQAVYRMIDAAAGSRAAVFITGESGTGKELCADAIHRASPRVDGPFVAVNCGAIPKDLIESEIFGHVKGAFTGAHADRKGAAERANGGTLFLDEICEMDISLQPKLLRFLQTGALLRVGDSRERPVDIRIISATNRDPLTEVREGRFREDLYYRLHVLPIHLPPLRERDRDMVEIANHFLEVYAKEEKRAFRRLSAETEMTLMAHHWPGNVRQLQNVIRNAVVLHDGEELTTDMLPPLVMEGADDPGYLPGPSPQPTPGALSYAPPAGQAVSVGQPVEQPTGPASIRPLAEVEREVIERALLLCEGNVAVAAYHLGISAATIYRKKQAWAQVDRSGRG
ncbi:MAG: sigma-54-dependent transcriptional regulator [Rhodospirillales bacterium]